MPLHAVVASALLLAPALAAAARCVAGNTTGRWREARAGDALHFADQPFVWERARDCAWSVQSRDDILLKFQGQRVAFIGDSTTRLGTYEFMMWAWGCDDIEAVAWKERFAGWPFLNVNNPVTPARYGSLGDVCNEVRIGQRWDRTNQDFVLPTGSQPSPRDITVQFRWAQYLYEVIDLLRTLFSGPPQAWPDLVFLNSGFWYLRAIPDAAPHGDTGYMGYWASLGALIASVTSVLPPAADARHRVVFRGHNLITMQDGRFNNDNIRELDNGTHFWWTAAGLPYARVLHYTPGSFPEWQKPEIVFTEDGYHPRRWVYRELLQEVLHVGVDALLAQGRVPHEGGEGTPPPSGSGVSSGAPLPPPSGSGSGSASTSASATPAPSRAGASPSSSTPPGAAANHGRGADPGGSPRPSRHRAGPVVDARAFPSQFYGGPHDASGALGLAAAICLLLVAASGRLWRPSPAPQDGPPADPDDEGDEEEADGDTRL